MYTSSALPLYDSMRLVHYTQFERKLFRAFISIRVYLKYFENSQKPWTAWKDQELDAYICVCVTKPIKIKRGLLPLGADVNDAIINSQVARLK